MWHLKTFACWLLLSALILATCMAAEDVAIRSFATGGHTVYHLRIASIEPNDESVLIAATTDGTVMCFSKKGVPQWKSQAGQSLVLDLEVADLDGDGRDDIMVASADGQLYVLDHTGKLRWQFGGIAPLIQVCALKTNDGKMTVLCGGIEKKLYSLSADGKVLDVFESPYVVRHIRKGDFLGDGKEYAAVVTIKNDRSRCFLHLFNPDGLKPLWDKPISLATDNPTEGTKYFVPWLAYRVAVFSMLPADINRDGKDEILMTDHFEKRGIFYAYNHKGEKVLTSSKKGIRGRAYRMNLLTHIPAAQTKDDRIFGLFGDQLIVYRLDGSIEKIVTGPYAHACGLFDRETRTYFLGSSISGGDGIYALKIDRPGWESAFTNLTPTGRIAQVEQNMARLDRQIDRFQRPAYQSPPKRSLVVTGKNAEEIEELFSSRHDYNNVRFAQFNLLTENFNRDVLAPPWNTKRETRHKYNFSAEEIIEFAAERERLKQPFVLWAGHGNDPFYMQLSTIEGILKAAPTMAVGLVFPEMERTDEAMRYAVQTHIIPIAELCRKHGTCKLTLRNKNIFWNASCYLDLWRETLLEGQYEDIFVPSMEETNGRTQAISLSGRMGLWLCGKFDHVSARAVTDNVNFSRLWEWGSQQQLSHLLRSLSLRASLGADIFLVNIYQGDPRQLSTFYRMVDKGVIAIPEREDLMSICDTCLGMKSPAPYFLKHGKNGHEINQYAPSKEEAVFDRMDCYWGAAPTNPSDFSNYAMGSRHRMLNFLPTNPYGLIASVPEEIDLDDFPFFRQMIRTDGEFFYTKQGDKISAIDYKETALQQLRDSANRLPVRVEGNVAWTVTRLGPNHVRVTMIDSGYISPADRQVRIVLQHLPGTQCTDILSGENLLLRQNTISLTVPAGILRIVDITHQ